MSSYKHMGSLNGGSGQSVVSAKLAGSYAVADPSGLNIEIRDVHRTLNLTALNLVLMIVELLPDMNLKS